MGHAAAGDDTSESQGRERRRPLLKVIILTTIATLVVLGAGGAWWLSSLGGMFAPSVCENSGDDLVAAAATGDTDRAAKIVNKTRRVTGPSTGHTPLYCAAKNGHTAIVKDLLAHGAPPDPSTPNETAPLFVAARDGRGDAVEALLAAGADPNRAESNGPALLAAVAGRSPSDNEFLLSDKHVSDFGEPPQEPLDGASRIAAVRALLKHGANPEGERMNDASPTPERTRPHPTPLFTASYTDQPLVASALLDGGANPSNPSYVVASELNRVVLGDRPGMTAVMRGTLPPPTAGFLSPASYRLPPIFAAAGQGRRQIVQSLLAAGADSNQEALGGFRPLHAAALSDDPEILRALLAAGADPTGHGVAVASPYSFALEQGRERSAEVLASSADGGG